MVSTRCASSELELGALWGVVARERQGALSCQVAESLVGRPSTANIPWHALSGEKAPDSAREKKQLDRR